MNQRVANKPIAAHEHANFPLSGGRLDHRLTTTRRACMLPAACRVWPALLGRADIKFCLTILGAERHSRELFPNARCLQRDRKSDRISVRTVPPDSCRARDLEGWGVSPGPHRSSSTALSISSSIDSAWSAGRTRIGHLGQDGCRRPSHAARSARAVATTASKVRDSGA